MRTDHYHDHNHYNNQHARGRRRVRQMTSQNQSRNQRQISDCLVKFSLSLTVYSLILTLHLFVIITINKMRKDLSPTIVLVMLLTLSSAGLLNCPTGSVLKDKSCVKCSSLTNTNISNKDRQVPNVCKCLQNYKWSKDAVECLKVDDQISSQRSAYPTHLLQGARQEPETTATPRLLASSCDFTKGFIFKNGQCINCRLIQYSTGMALSNTECVCTGLFVWWPDYQVCTCRLISTQNLYLYLNNGVCASCASIIDGTNRGHCNKNCSGGSFGLGIAGCFNCTTIPHGTGANTGICTCSKGYRFSYSLSQCICDYWSDYSVTYAGCIACSTIAGSTDRSNCISCRPPYFHNGYYCVMGYTIPNYNTTAGACNVGYAKQTNPITLLQVCSCSLSNGYFLNTNLCSMCSTSTNGLSVSSCLSCSQDEGYFQNGVTCIYCPGVLASTGAASSDGCGCLVTYFWNTLTETCQCDWVNGYTLIEGRCRYCLYTTNAYSNSTQCIFFNCSVANCVWCNSTQTCQSCASGYMLTNNSCLFFNCSIPNCLVCNSTSTCFSCTASLILSNNTCPLNCNITNCAVCNSTTNCSSCYSGFIPSVSGRTCLYNCSIAYCLTCSSMTTCSSCATGHILDSNATHCPFNCYIYSCATCNSTTTCSSCNNGFIPNPDGTYCVYNCSIANCQYCWSTNRCGWCINGYYLNYNYTKCLICRITYCSTCNSTTTCSSCDGGAFLNVDATQCIYNCSITNCDYCSSNTTCSYCVTGYKLNYNSSLCLICYVNNCLTCNSTTTCSSCNPGTILNIDATYCMQDCSIPNCYYCWSETYCYRCIQGYYLNYNSKCIICFIYYCSTCKSNTTCSSCDIGRSLNQDATQCIYNCSIPNCNTCQSNSTCSRCDSGSQLNFNSTSCILQCNVVNCKSCYYSISCLACLKGYSLINGLCISNCPDGIEVGTGSNLWCYPCSNLSQFCLSCSPLQNLFTCTVCASVSYLSANGTVNNTCVLCSSAIANCLQCFSSSTCTKCFYPYTLLNQTCAFIQCQVINCQVCSAFNSSVCQMCAAGFNFNSSTQQCDTPICEPGFLFLNESCVCARTTMLFGGTCVSCQKYCATCYIYGCLTCQIGYYLVDWYCKPCSSNCAYCFQSGCIQCSKGFTLLKSGICQSVAGGMSVTIVNQSIIPCAPGCEVCVASVSNQIFCIFAQEGYSISGGVATKCINSACLSCVAGTSACTSCFSGSVLIGGSCLPCSDPNAISCLSTNLNYSTSCTPKYSTVSSNTSAGDYCLPCASNCLKCDFNGPGNCDPRYCIKGYVQQTGTLNCTACFNSCLICDQKDLYICFLYGPNSIYQNSSNLTVEKSCAVGCRICNYTSGCSSCQMGYSFMDNLCSPNLPYPCATMSNASTCGACFQGYALSGSICVLDLSCNTNFSCPACPYGYYLTNGTCSSCPPLSKCRSCNSDNQCTLCYKGYYLNFTACLACNSNCLDCSSLTYCKKAANGYYLRINNDGSYSGKVYSCESPCLTCQQNSDYCLTCIGGYAISGSGCFSNALVMIRMVLGPGTTNTKSIFSSSDSTNTQLYKALKSLNRILVSLCNRLPSAFKVNDPFCQKNLRITSMTAGSVQLDFQVSAAGMTDSNAAENSIISTLFGELDGARIMTLSVTVQNFPSSSGSSISSSSSNSNMPLILGASIGGVVFGTFILAIVIFVAARKKINSKEADQKIQNQQIFNTVQTQKQLNMPAQGLEQPEFQFQNVITNPHQQKARIAPRDVVLMANDEICPNAIHPPPRLVDPIIVPNEIILITKKERKPNESPAMSCDQLSPPFGMRDTI